MAMGGNRSYRWMAWPIRRAMKRRSPTFARILVAVGLVCLVGPAVHAQFIIQPIGLQAAVNPQTTITGQIKLLNASLETSPAPRRVKLTIVDLVKDHDHQWKPLDPNMTPEPNQPASLSAAASCRGWIHLNQTDVVVNPLSVVTIPVAIQVPQRRVGFYRAAIAISIPFVDGPVGVPIQYDIVVPVLMEIEDGGHPVAWGRYVVMISPKSILLCQGANSSDPYHTYAGSAKAEIAAGVESRLIVASAVATSPAGGEWKASIDEGLIRLTGEHVYIEKIPRGAKDIRVALVTLQVVPVPSAWSFVWDDL
jgi:hypothetical protein